MALTRRSSRDAALVELQRLHTAILASRARRGVGPEAVPAPSPEAIAAQDLTRRLQRDATPSDDAGTGASRSRRGWWLAVAVAVVVAGAWVALTLSQRPEVVTEAAPPRSAPPTDPRPNAAPAPDAEVASAATRPTAIPPAGPTAPIAVTLQTIRPVWLRVVVDGVRVIEREVPAGETLSFGGTRAVVVRSGDAGGVRATLNGANRGPLGKDGWPVTVPFTLDPPPAPALPR